MIIRLILPYHITEFQVCCNSINHNSHGIPSEKILKEGDILNDVTALKNGWHGDTRMFKVGEVSIKAEKLIKTTYEAMMNKLILSICIHLGDIGSQFKPMWKLKDFLLSKIL